MNFNDPAMMKKMAQMMSREEMEEFKNNFNDPATIRKMAQAMAAEQAGELFSGNYKMGQERPQAPPEQKKEYEKNFEVSRDQVKITNENIKNILSKSQTVTCDKCDSYTFMQVTIVKRVSPFISPSGKETMVPVQALACSKCSHINDVFLPADAITDILDKKKIQ